MIPHLMGLQYIGRADMFTGDRGVYMIKKQRVKYESLEKLVRKYYHGQNKQDSILAMVLGKINNLHKIKDMLSTYSQLYLYDVTANPESGLKTDYLLVNQQKDMVLQLGMIKVDKNKTQEYHCNSFMVDYKVNENYDLHYRNLTKCYEISKIVKKDKNTKCAVVIYQSSAAEKREKDGIRKMLFQAGISADEKLISAVFGLNQKFGEYHTFEMLKNSEMLLDKCHNEYEQMEVKEFINLWRYYPPK